MVLKPWRFVDATTGEPAVSYNTLMVDGGWLARVLGISEGGVPLTFDGNCGPKVDLKKLLKSLEITALDRPGSTSNGN